MSAAPLAQRLALPAAIVAALVLLIGFHEVVSAAVRDGVEKRQAFLRKPPVSPCHGLSDIESLEQCMSNEEPQRLARR